jgi:hypothetical protein
MRSENKLSITNSKISRSDISMNELLDSKKQCIEVNNENI